MRDKPYGRVLLGCGQDMDAFFRRFTDQPVDQELPPSGADSAYPSAQTTLGRKVPVTGPGTFLRKAQRTLTFEPASKGGWRFNRQDLADTMPIDVSVANVWTTARNIVLCSGSPHNYMRMVEHIVALKVGMGVDNLVIGVTSGDPPLFERGSLDLVDAFQAAGIVAQNQPATYLTVKEPVTAIGPHGSFLTFLPAQDGKRQLILDCALDFRNAIGRQRVRFAVTPDIFCRGAGARTNTTMGMMLLYKTVGLLFADMRRMGYNLRNILIAGPRRYLNLPRLMHNGKSLEAAWHRAVMDLLAAVALIDRGRFAGTILSYKAGHTLDVQMVRALYEEDLLVEM